MSRRVFAVHCADYHRFFFGQLVFSFVAEVIDVQCSQESYKHKSLQGFGVHRDTYWPKACGDSSALCV